MYVQKVCPPIALTSLLTSTRILDYSKITVLFNVRDDVVFKQQDKHEKRSYSEKLKNNKIAVIAPAGDGFDRYYSKQGMAYPAIIPETISVGAIYDAQIGFQGYDSGAYTEKTAPEQITPFSQRLHSTKNQKAQTDIFAPGVDIESSTIIDSEKYSKLSGTSQAAPYVTGVVLLLQEYHLRKTSKRPSIDNLKTYLRTGGFVTPDKDTGLNFMRLNVLGAFEEMQKDIEP